MADDIEAIVFLLLRADWTSLCFSAELTTMLDQSIRSLMFQSAAPASPWRNRPDPAAWEAAAGGGADPGSRPDAETVLSRSHLLVAPGGRFRHEFSRDDGPTLVIGSDGERSWDIDDDDDERSRPPARELLLPAWLPSRFELELAGREILEGRPVLRIVARPRPLLRGRWAPGQNALLTMLPLPSCEPGDELLDRVDVVVDAELGILLRCERLFDGLVVSRTELSQLTIEPPEAADPSRFERPAADDRSGDSDGETVNPEPPFSGPGWQLAKTAASIGASVLGFAVKHKSQGSTGPAQSPPAAGEWPPNDQDDELAAPAGTDSGPVGDHILKLLYRSGLRVAELDAEVRTWLDIEARLTSMKSAGERWDMTGLGQLADAMVERGTQQRQLALLRLGAADRYRIDYAENSGGRKTRTIAVDGEHRGRVYADRTTVGPAVPLPADLARLIDPAWLLSCQLTGGSEVTFDGRPAFAVRLQDAGRPVWLDGGAADAVVDAELGLLLQLRCSSEGKPVSRVELRQVRPGQQHTAADFRIEIPAGTRVIKETGTFLDEVNAPPAVRAVAGLAKRAFAGAAAAHQYAERFRRGDAGRQDRPH
jgi:hypothetical protein